MRIVLDSSVISGDYALQGAVIRSVLDSVKHAGAELYVPRVVLDEVAANYERALRSSLDQLKQVAEKVGRLLRETIKLPSAQRDLAAEADKYRKWLQQRLKDAGAKIVDYPGESISELVKRATSHKKPFAPEGDRGFKDYLIWRNVLDLAETSETLIVLVSGNTKDFTDGQGHLHSDPRSSSSGST